MGISFQAQTKWLKAWRSSPQSVACAGKKRVRCSTARRWPELRESPVAPQAAQSPSTGRWRSNTFRHAGSEALPSRSESGARSGCGNLLLDSAWRALQDLIHGQDGHRGARGCRRGAQLHEGLRLSQASSTGAARDRMFSCARRQRIRNAEQPAQHALHVAVHRAAAPRHPKIHARQRRCGTIRGGAILLLNPAPRVPLCALRRHAACVLAGM